jgi:hypothetical protein
MCRLFRGHCGGEVAVVDKVKLPKEVAEVLVHIEQTYDYPIRAVVEMFNSKSAAYKDLREYFEQDRSRRIEAIMKALVNGYEVEETPEDKVRAHFKRLLESGKHNEANVIHVTLDYLGIKISGVNA